MDQVIANLVGNAIKYGAGTPVTLSMTPVGSGRARFSVSDRGPGIPLEHQERIFGQFERAEGTDAVPGMGLGLWLARRIVTAHGGTITVDSSPGKGAVFTVILPVQAASVPGGNLPSAQIES
jgi:signal transduction histidine kinase